MAVKKKLTFEQKLASVEQLITAMEEGNCTLEQTISHYEEGVTLLQELEAELNAVSQRLTVLRKKQDGSLQEEPLEVEP